MRREVPAIEESETAGIGYLERFVADYEQKMGTHVVPKVAPTGKKIAIVGSGPQDSRSLET